MKANTHIQVEQDVDIVIKKLFRKWLGQLYDQVLVTTDGRYKQYKEANKDRKILEDCLLFLENYGETGSVKQYQVPIAMQLVDEIIRNLHGEIGRHPGTTKTMIAYGEKKHYPNIAQLTRKWVMS